MQQIAEHGTIAADVNTIKAVTAAFVAGKAEIKEAEELLVKAKQSQIEKVRAACVNVKPVSTDEWETHWRPVVRAELKAAGYSDKSIPVMESNLKFAVIAITHKIVPRADESFTAFVTRAREELKVRDIIQTNGAGRPKDDKPTKKVGKSARQEALELLARGGDDELPDEQVRKRARALDHAITVIGWERLIAWVAEESKKINKPLHLAA